MKLSVVRGGGILGVATRTEVSSDALSPEAAQTLREKVNEAGMRRLAEVAPTGARHPEDLLIELTVEDEGQVHTVRLRESTLPEAVRSLIAWADSLPGAEHTLEVPGTKAEGA